MHQTIDIDIVLPIESCKLIINSKHVQIRSDGIDQLAKLVYANIKANKLNVFTNWKSFELNPKKMNEFAINWIFIVEALNFSLWHHPKSQTSTNKYQVTYNGVTYKGHRALQAAINRALDDGYPITEPFYYASITSDELKYILRSDTIMEIPLLENRVNVLRETGAILIEEFQGSFLNCIKLANGSAIYLLKLIVDNFPSFKDEISFMGEKITFYKKAQAVITNIFACFEGRGFGSFFDIDEISVCADYQIPQVLRYYNAITYSDELTKYLISNKLMNNGDEYEVDIRAASLIACRIPHHVRFYTSIFLSLVFTKLITENVRKLIKNDATKAAAAVATTTMLSLSDQYHQNNFYINDIILNFHLSNYRIENSSEIDYFIPFQKVYCNYY